MNIQNYVIDAAEAASTSNFVVLNQYVHIGATLTTRTPVFRLLDARPPVIFKATAAEVLQVQDVTVTGTANGVTYSFNVQSYYSLLQQQVSIPVTITTPSTGTITATTIAAQIVAAITANTNSHVTATNVAGVITLTAKTGYAVFRVTVNNQGDGTGTMVASTPSTAGVIAFGKSPYIDLQRWGLTPAQYTGSTAGYSAYFIIADQMYAETNAVTTQKPSHVNIWINTDDAQAAALITAIDLVLNAATYQPQEFDLLP